MANSNINFVQNGNNFLHGVRGTIYLDGEVAGAVQDISVNFGGEEDLVYVYGSRYIQAKEIKNYIVTGTIKTVVFDPTVQKLFKLSEPSKKNVITNNELLNDGSGDGNILSYSDTQLSFSRTTNEAVSSLLPIFDIQVDGAVINEDGDFDATGFVIKGVIIKGYNISFLKDSYWMTDVQIVADKLVRVGKNNNSTG